MCNKPEIKSKKVPLFYETNEQLLFSRKIGLKTKTIIDFKPTTSRFYRIDQGLQTHSPQTACITPGVNFTNVSHAAFTLVVPKSIKNAVKSSVSLYAFKIFEHKSCTFMKLSPVVFDGNSLQNRHMLEKY